ncbi:MAG: hypothetical protein U9R56_02415 [candidate division Zixibacteria bacterium]|nr:hypothetical protein [candidate division Zixibacteria bacterium]
MSLFRSDMDLPDPEQSPLPAEEDAVLDKVARKVVERRMGVPAILFLESVKPLNYIGAQTMVFFEPVVQAVFNFKDYNTLRHAFEKRETVEILLLKIEALGAVATQRDKRIRKFIKQEKKSWKWYQRWLGVFTPKVKIPDDVLNPSEDEISDHK